MKREPEIVRMELMPERPPEVIIYGKTRNEVAKKAGRGVQRGQYGAVSEVLCTSGGRYVAKATLIARPEPKRRAPSEPLPTWARVLIRIAWALAGMVAALALLAFALSALFGALVNLPWLAMLGAAGAVAILLLCTGAGRSAVTVIVKVFIH